MIANIPGSYLTEQVGQEAVPPVKVTTSTERRKTEDMLRGLAEGRADVVVGMSNLGAKSRVSFLVLGRHSVLE
jgi:phosphopantothenoylcysteine synthetase/decarboxylase